MKAKLISITAALGVAACSTNATIRRNNGYDEEGEIVRRTPTALVLKDRGGERLVPLHDVRDIDHPGNVHVLVGTLLVAYGILNIKVGAPQCEEKGPAFCVGVFTPAAVGLGMFTWGAAVYARSAEAAKATSQSARLSLAPWVARAPTGYRGGAVLSLGL